MNAILIILFLIVVIFIILFLLKNLNKSAKRISEKNTKNNFRKSLSNKERSRQESTEQENTSYIYLSVLENYLKRYGLDITEKSFFKLITLIIKDGQKNTLNKLKELLNSKNSVDVASKAIAVVTSYSLLVSEQTAMNIKEGRQDRNSPKIYKAAVEKYLTDFDLISLANTDINKAMLTVMERLYDLGKQQIMNKFEINIKWLKEYIAKNQTDKIKNTLEKFIEEIEEELVNI